MRPPRDNPGVPGTAGLPGTKVGSESVSRCSLAGDTLLGDTLWLLVGHFGYASGTVGVRGGPKVTIWSSEGAPKSVSQAGGLRDTLLDPSFITLGLPIGALGKKRSLLANDD